MSYKRGMTLIEVLLAITLLTIALFSVINLFLSLSHYWQSKRTLLGAQEKLHKQLSILMNTPWDQLTNGTTREGIYDISWTIQKTGDDLLARITVTVQWRDPKGELRNIQGYIERYRYIVPPSTLTNPNPYGTTLPAEQ